MKLGLIPGHWARFEQLCWDWHLSQEKWHPLEGPRPRKSSRAQGRRNNCFYWSHDQGVYPARFKILLGHVAPFPTSSSRHWAKFLLQYLQLPSLLWSLSSRRAHFWAVHIVLLLKLADKVHQRSHLGVRWGLNSETERGLLTICQTAQSSQGLDPDLVLLPRHISSGWESTAGLSWPPV